MSWPGTHSSVQLGHGHKARGSLLLIPTASVALLGLRDSWAGVSGEDRPDSRLAWSLIDSVTLQWPLVNTVWFLFSCQPRVGPGLLILWAWADLEQACSFWPVSISLSLSFLQPTPTTGAVMITSWLAPLLLNFLVCSTKEACGYYLPK